MALINCNECGNQVSDKAAACPKCGAPVQNGSTVAVQTSNVGSSPSNLNPHQGNETVYYSDDKGVKITNTRFIVDSSTYPLQGITSIKSVLIPVSRMPGILMLIGGIIVAVVGSNSGAALILGLAVAVGGFLIILGTKDKHAVKISTSAAETNALVSENKEYIAKVATALNEAIIHRG
jgi:hypothetical protein